MCFLELSTPDALLKSAQSMINTLYRKYSPRNNTFIQVFQKISLQLFGKVSAEWEFVRKV